VRSCSADGFRHWCLDALAGAERAASAGERHLDLPGHHLDALVVIAVAMRGHAAAGLDLDRGDGARAAALARGLEEGHLLARRRVDDGALH
jgi:hypothetical protein